MESRHMFQALAVLLVVACIKNLSTLDSLVARVWKVAKASSLFRHDSWEPGVVAVAWPLFTGFWYILDTKIPQAKRFQINQSNDLSLWKVEGFHRKQEVLVYLLPLAMFDLVYPRRVIPEEAPSTARLLSEVLLSLFFYDLFFTVVHYISHKVPWLYKNMHAKHHANKIQRACEAMRLSVGDEVLDVACSIAALNLVKAHPLSRTVYNITIVWLIIELHSGYDFPWMMQSIVPGGVWGGSVRHAAHHATGNVYYQKFFTYIDIWLGAELPDGPYQGVSTGVKL